MNETLCDGSGNPYVNSPPSSSSPKSPEMSKKKKFGFFIVTSHNIKMDLNKQIWKGDRAALTQDWLLRPAGERR